MFDHDHPSQGAAIRSVAEKIGCTAETLRNWVRQAERDHGRRAGPSTDERQRIKELERENGPPSDPTGAARYVLRSLAQRWLALHEEIKEHTRHLKRITNQVAPQLTAAFGIGFDCAAEMLTTADDNGERIRSEAAFAKLCGVCPVPAWSGKTTGRHRLNRGGNRQANAALYRIVVVRLRWHQPTIDYAARRTSEGRTKKEIIRCLKRYVAREVFHLLPRQVEPSLRNLPSGT